MKTPLERIEWWLSLSRPIKPEVAREMVAEIKQLRAGIDDALGRFQVTHIHSALRQVRR